MFYSALGFDAVVGGSHAPFTTYRAGDGFLNLQLDTDYTLGGVIWARAIFWVTDVDALYARARDHGYEPEMPPADASWASATSISVTPTVTSSASPGCSSAEPRSYKVGPWDSSRAGSR